MKATNIKELDTKVYAFGSNMIERSIPNTKRYVGYRKKHGMKKKSIFLEFLKEAYSKNL